MLRHCQKELENLQQMSKPLALAAPQMPQAPVTASKLPRRLQRLIQNEAQRTGLISALPMVAGQLLVDIWDGNGI